MTKFAGPLVLAATLTVGCISNKPKEVTHPSCTEVVQAWGKPLEAEGRQFQGQPMPDGGVMVAAIGLKNVKILAVLSQKQAPQFLPKAKEAGLVADGEMGECAHPENGYVYVSIPLVKEMKFEEANGPSTGANL